MRWHTNNERERESYDTRRKRRWWPLVSRSFYLYGVPVPALTCRVLGHDPVIDGTGPLRGDLGRRDLGARWVACRRCWVRGDPQGSLDPQVFAIGDRYRGPFVPVPPKGTERWDALTDRKGRFYAPGPLPAAGTADVSGQLVIGPHFRPHYVGFQIKVGNTGSENAFGGWIQLGWLGSLFWSSGNLGRGLARRLNPDREHYISREIGAHVELWGFSWKLWAPRDRWSRDDPKWMQGSVDLNLLNRLLGQRRYRHDDVGEVHRILRLPEGGDRLTRLKLRRVTSARKRGPHRRPTWWEVSWMVEGPSIPTSIGADDNGMRGASVRVDEQAVRCGTWPSAAIAAITAQVVKWRTGYGFDPVQPVPIPIEVAT